MKLNKLKLYIPNQGNGGEILDEPYSEAVWDGDTKGGASRNAIRDKLEVMGLIGKVVVVDALYGDDSTAKVDNILKPFKTHQAAANYIVGGTPSVVITMPGTYTISSIFGFPLQDLVDHIFINATINITAPYSYGTFLIYPNKISCRLSGKATFNNLSANNQWGMITPYFGCDLQLDGLTFNGNRPVFAQLGGPVERKNIRIKNCRFNSTLNNTSVVTNSGNLNATGDTYVVIEDSYVKGTTFLSTPNGLGAEEFIFKAYRTQFEGLSGNPSGINASLALLEYGDATTAKVLLKDCLFKAPHECLYAGVGYIGLANGKIIQIDNCRFVSGPEGWLRSESADLGYKLLGNLATVGQSGTYPVVNLLSGAGMVIEPGLEVF